MGLWNYHVSELCKKWIYDDGNYAYARFEELHTCSGEVVFTREHKAAISKNISKTYIDIDDLKIFKDFSTSDKIMNKTKDKNKPTTKTKTKDKDTLDTINNKIDMINKLYNGIKKSKGKSNKEDRIDI